MAKTKEAAPSEMHATKMIGGGHMMEATRVERGSKKKHIRSIRTKRAKGGGHIVTHEYEHGHDMGYTPDQDHVFGKDEGVKHMEHYMRHAGVKGVTVAASGAGDGEAEPPAENAEAEAPEAEGESA